MDRRSSCIREVTREVLGSRRIMMVGGEKEWSKERWNP